MYYDGVEKLRSLPVSWTDAALPDSVIAAGRGRAHFRAEDLLQIAERVDYLRLTPDSSSEGCKVK